MYIEYTSNCIQYWTVHQVVVSNASLACDVYRMHPGWCNHGRGVNKGWAGVEGEGWSGVQPNTLIFNFLQLQYTRIFHFYDAFEVVNNNWMSSEKNFTFFHLQAFQFTLLYEFRQDEACLDVSQSFSGAKITFYGCHELKGNQEFRYTKVNVITPVGNKCNLSISTV